jgi:tRNA (guanine37-N1)-methyltransferase
MRFEIITLFPELFGPFMQKGLVGKANEAGVIQLVCTNPRDFAKNKHKSVDDAPYGGGNGMVMMPGPVLEAIEAREAPEAGGRVHRILLSPQGKPLDQATARRLAGYPAIALVCGRYEGIDERVCDAMDEQISLGDFVMTGGEVAAMAVIEATARLLPGVLGNLDSTRDESHAAGLLEYPQYTRPPEFRGQSVPEVLLSGDHAAIERYRRKESLRRTRAQRPDLFAAHGLDATDRKLLAELDAQDERAAREVAVEPSPSVTERAPIYIGLVHYPVKDREGNIVTTAVTNLDVHDLSRSSRSYGLAGYYVITPIEAQRELVDKILEHWIDGSGKRRVPQRGEALSLCTPIDSIDATLAAIEAKHGQAPVIAITAARLPPHLKPSTLAEIQHQMRTGSRPWLVLFGTGHGLANEVLERAEVALPPIRPGVYNHLSVRAAGAITLDRLFGDQGAG